MSGGRVVDPAEMREIGWIVGFVDGEGCFCVSFNKLAKNSVGIEVRPSFSVAQHANGCTMETTAQSVNYATLEIFIRRFGGGIRHSAGDGTWKYETRKLDVLCDRVIPFFQTYPLKTRKQRDFPLFAEICILVRQSQHLNAVGLENIINLAYRMNPAGRRGRTKEELLALIIGRARTA